MENFRRVHFSTFLLLLAAAAAVPGDLIPTSSLFETPPEIPEQGDVGGGGLLIPTSSPFDTACPTYFCGYPVSYPFFAIRPGASAYCGYPGFGLICSSSDSPPRIQLLDGTYTVTSISYKDRNLTLLDCDTLMSQSTCPRARHTLEVSPLTPLTYPNQSLTFYFNCSGVPASIPFIECMEVFEGRKSYVFKEGNETEGYEWERGCWETVTVPTAVEDWVDVAAVLNGFGAAMRNGFGLKWAVMMDCGQCEASGGRCGYREKAANAAPEFFCYCEDGGTATVKCTKATVTDGDSKALITLVSVVGAILAAFGLFLYLMSMIKRKRGRNSKGVMLFDCYAANPPFYNDDIENAKIERNKLQDLPLFSFKVLAASTNKFDPANKLGQGGFGPVYMGFLVDGNKIAVKRLSKASGQGRDEFMNEVILISKLQHRNLVRLLGCCVEMDEKLLVYEYMANQSLDAYLFDPAKRELLQWRKRFEIIQGVGRGLLYLHRDSRLRIIHRDLKASNILLDEELNPKISDFGLARIIESNQDQVNTLRVVGTYGYMSPEYAMEGRFSEKSDVFSFGVLVLEIVSGRRNTSFFEEEGPMSLLGYAWNMWNEGSTESVIDTAISSSSALEEIQRCIHIGLLCVQELASDRPSVSTILSILSSEIAVLPPPKQPAFISTQPSALVDDAEQLVSVRFSVNIVSVTDVQGR